MSLDDFARRGVDAQRAVDQVLAKHRVSPVTTVMTFPLVLNGAEVDHAERWIRANVLSPKVGGENPQGWQIMDEAGVRNMAMALVCYAQSLQLDATKRTAIAAIIRSLRARVLKDGRDLHEDETSHGRGHHHEPFEECSGPICVSLREFLQRTDDVVEKETP